MLYTLYIIYIHIYTYIRYIYTDAIRTELANLTLTRSSTIPSMSTREVTLKHTEWGQIDGRRVSSSPI